MLKIMIVEDQPALRLALREFLQTSYPAAHLLEASTGAEAIRLCLDAHPSVVLVDIGLPDWNGIALAAEIRRLAPNCRIVMVTQYADKAHIDGARAAGADAYVVKDRVAQELIGAIGEIGGEAAPQSPKTGKPIAVLLVEDSETDALLVVRVLTRWGFEVRYKRVQTRDALREALQEGGWDAVISDFNLPAMTALDALAIFKSTGLDIPFIVISGSIGEEAAAAVMKAGAGDYLVKQKLDRLAPALERALHEAAIRSAHRQAKRDLEDSEAGLRHAERVAKLAHIITGPDGTFERWSETLPQLIGADPERVPANARKWLHAIHPDDRDEFSRRANHAAATGSRTEIEYRMRRSDGGWSSIHQVIEPLEPVPHRAGEQRWFNTLQDVSAQKAAEEELRRFRLAMDSSGDMICLIDRATMRYVDVNPAFTTLLGYSREEMLALGPQDVLPASREELERSYDALIEAPSVTGAMNSYYQCKDGSHLPFESTRRVLRSGDSWIIVAVARDIRARLVSESALRESESIKSAILESSLDCIVTMDEKGRVLEFNSAAQATFGYSREQALGGYLHDLIVPPKFRQSHITGLARYLSSGKSSLLGKRVELEAMRSDGTEFPVELAITPIQSGARRLFTGFIRDISDRREAEGKIRRLNRVYAVLSGINAAIARMGDREDLHREACRVAVSEGGFVAARVIELDRNSRARIAATAGSSGVGIADALDEYNRSPATAQSLLAEVLREGEPLFSNDVSKDPRILASATNSGANAVALLPLKVEKCTVGALVLGASETGRFDAEEMKLLARLAGDISFALEHIEKSEKVTRLALFDPLTGLANRTLVLERIDQAVRSRAQPGGKFAVVLWDLERFRTVNDALGRAGGDSLLANVAERLVRMGGPVEIGRIGGDQFSMVLAPVKGRSEARRIVSDRARGLLAEPFPADGTELEISAKTGIAMFPADGRDAETLLKNADVALRKGKQTGDKHTFYTRSLHEQTASTLTLENKLRRALERDEFVLHYQPKVEMTSRSIVGVEALIRWQSPELGLVPPIKFIGLLEETGLILEVGAWALKRASLDHLGWAKAGLQPPRIAVNVSPIQLRRPEFVTTVKNAIASGSVPTGIDLEITESMVMEDIEGNVHKLKEIRDLGMSIAIDDFGTGYSSLAYLAKLPLQTLKIDRSFIITMLNEPDNMALVQMIMSLAHALRLKVVAEGVDDEQQAKMLRLLRCDEMQGYLFSKPLPLDQMTALLEREKTN